MSLFLSNSNQFRNSKPSSDLWSNKCWASRVWNPIWKFGSKRKKSVERTEKRHSIAAHHSTWKTCGVGPPKHNLHVFHKSYSCPPPSGQHIPSISPPFLPHPSHSIHSGLFICAARDKHSQISWGTPIFKTVQKEALSLETCSHPLKKNQLNFLLRRFMATWGSQRTAELKNTTALGD